MTLKELFEKQHRLMQAIHPDYMNTYQSQDKINEATSLIPNSDKVLLEHFKEQETRILVLALTDELHEVLRETNWKPWKKTHKPVNQDKLAEEIADSWHFLLELTMLWNLEDKIEGRLEKTFAKNHERAANGY